jgi:hypothetical protein
MQIHASSDFSGLMALMAGYLSPVFCDCPHFGSFIQSQFFTATRLAFFSALAASSNTVRWHCVSGPEDWIGTDITFELAEQDNLTIVLFGHRNWREATESSAHCSMKWATFLLSLRALVETGKGRPAPDDLKIDNWN